MALASLLVACGGHGSGTPQDDTNDVRDASSSIPGEDVADPGAESTPPGSDSFTDASSHELLDGALLEPSEAGGGGDAGADRGDAGGGGPERCVGRAPIAPKWKLVWSDEFDQDGAPNPSNWGFERGFVRNEELQWYQPQNATVHAGVLTISAQRQKVANPNYVAGSTNWKTNRQYAQYTSSSLTSSGKRSFEYGRFEMCGQIDTRLGSWPAFWILGDGRSWPSSGEVDIMEYYTNDVRANVCKPSGNTCNWSGSVAQPLSSIGGSGFATGFHLWAMEWNATDIDLYLDDQLVYDFKVSSLSSATNPYTGNRFYIIVNQAIGGGSGGDPSNTAFPVDYHVDYVRVYQ